MFVELDDKRRILIDTEFEIHLPYDMCSYEDRACFIIYRYQEKHYLANDICHILYTWLKQINKLDLFERPIPKTLLKILPEFEGFVKKVRLIK